VLGYLLDTSALAPLVDDLHPKHAFARAIIASIGNAPVIALAEMKYGMALHEKSKGTKLANAEKMLNEARRFPIVDVEHHTADEYAQLKSNLAVYYLPNQTKRFRKKYVEDWLDQFTGKALGIDDNDLWICAQARELNLTVIADDKMNRIKDADRLVKILPITP
jgi:predicted nucleic acid-binding protein